jgi:uncharacterized protein
MKLSRRSFLRALSMTPAAMLPGYSLLIEPTWLDVSLTTVKLSPDADRQVRLLHLSDLHFSGEASVRLLEKAISRGLDYAPRLACLTGDFINLRLEDQGSYLALLRRLSRALPCYAVLGNHDGAGWAAECGGYKDTETMRDFLSSAGICCLHNSAVDLDSLAQGLSLAGVGDIWSGEFKPEEAFGRFSRDGHRQIILLSHNPDSKDPLRHYPWSLMLSGHTHGGQVRVPIVGLAPLVPVGDQHFIAGLHSWGRRYIYVTKGLAALAGVRFNCRPEVSILDVWV